uniref:Tankyrase 1-binding protein C-terminal domain-containing protein n=1 Tax=Astyanax mexicanus TaxID=7994 RepID=A0A8B9GWA1_ASTMX
MDYLGDKLSVAHSQMSGWVGSVRRSLQGALSFVSSSIERGGGGGGGDGGGGVEEGSGFKRAASLRSLASRSRESFRRFSLRSQQRLSLRRRATPSSPATPSTPSPEQVKQSGQDEHKDTDTLVQETDSQYGTWETGLRTDESLTPATPSSDGLLTPSPRKPTPAQTPEEPTPADATPVDTPISPAPSAEEPLEPLAFPETPTTLLDSSALRSRAQLGKRMSRRAPPSRTARHSAAFTQLTTAEEEEWRYRDSTEDKTDSKPQEEEESDSEEQPRESRTPTSSAASSQPQRVSLFPGMDPSAIMAQLKKRGDGDTPDGPTPSASSSQLSRSPKSPFLPRAARVLPPAGNKENGEAASPQWLKELKTKKRLSQYENES